MSPGTQAHRHARVLAEIIDEDDVLGLQLVCGDIGVDALRLVVPAHDEAFAAHHLAAVGVPPHPAVPLELA
jgi:hypothetical protein